MSDGEVRPFLGKTYQNLFQISLDISPECFLFDITVFYGTQELWRFYGDIFIFVAKK